MVLKIVMSLILYSTSIAYAVDDIVSNACLGGDTVLVLKKLAFSREQIESLKATLELRSIEDIQRFETYIQMLPPIGRGEWFRRFIVGKPPKLIINVVERLARENLAELGNRLLLTKYSELSLEDRIIFDVLAFESWQTATTSKVIAALEYIPLQESVLKAYANREKLLGEFTTVEDYFVNLNIDKYKRIATIAHLATDTKSIVRMFRDRNVFIRREIRQSQSSYRRIWLRSLEKQTNLLINLISKNESRWEAEIARLESQMNSPGLSNWLSKIINPDWKQQWIGDRKVKLTTALVVSILVGFAAHSLNLDGEAIALLKPRFSFIYSTERENSPINQAINELQQEQPNMEDLRNQFKSGTNPLTED